MLLFEINRSTHTHKQSFLLLSTKTQRESQYLPKYAQPDRSIRPALAGGPRVLRAVTCGTAGDDGGDDRSLHCGLIQDSGHITGTQSPDRAGGGGVGAAHI